MHASNAFGVESRHHDDVALAATATATNTTMVQILRLYPTFDRRHCSPYSVYRIGSIWTSASSSRVITLTVGQSRRKRQFSRQRYHPVGRKYTAKWSDKALLFLLFAVRPDSRQQQVYEIDPGFILRVDADKKDDDCPPSED